SQDQYGMGQQGQGVSIKGILETTDHNGLVAEADEDSLVEYKDDMPDHQREIFRGKTIEALKKGVRLSNLYLDRIDYERVKLCLVSESKADPEERLIRAWSDLNSRDIMAVETLSRRCMGSPDSLLPGHLLIDEDLNALRVKRVKRLDTAKARPFVMEGYPRRVCDDPSDKFLNTTYEGATKRLLGGNIGDCIFRPSREGLDYLSLSVKVFPTNVTGGLPANYEIRELGERTSINDLNVRPPFAIRGMPEKYDDFTHIVEEFVSSLVSRLAKAQQFKYFTSGSRQDIRTRLLEKAKKGSYMSYVICPFPGGVKGGLIGELQLCYLRKNKDSLTWEQCNGDDDLWTAQFRMTRERIDVLADRYRFRGRDFVDFQLEPLVGYWKRHFSSDMSPFTAREWMEGADGGRTGVSVSAKPAGSVTGANTYAADW
ncbi:transcription elongation factor Spt6, partial [Kipferlia bialata]